MTRRLLFLLLTLALLALAPACEGDGEGTLPPVGDDDAAADDDDAGDDDDATPPPTYPESITLTTADGKTLQGTWQDAPGVDNGPAVVFLHQITRDRQDFQTVWFNFLDAGISVLAFDFRGHGSSDDADLDMIDLLTTPGHLEHDMDAAIAFAAEQDVVDPSRIGVFGLDVGANLAILASHRADLDVKIICAVSADVAADWGSAISPIYAGARAGKTQRVFVDETRPRSQGARLTAWELAGEGIEHHVIADNAFGFLASRGEIQAVITGADRVARNGDVANKIGTFGHAVICRHVGIPFYVALPSATIDPDCVGGEAIPIEERSADEVKFTWGFDDDGRFRRVRTTPAASGARNPAFDVTPAELVDGLITEHGVFPASRDGVGRILDLSAHSDN